MFIRFFKSAQPAALFILPLLSALFVLMVYLLNKNSIIVDESHGILYSLFLLIPAISLKWVSALVVFALITFQAIYFNRIVSAFEVLYKPSNLPALIYIVLACLLPAFIGLHPFILINTLLLWILQKIFRLYKNDESLGICFDIGFLVSILSMIYYPCIFLFIFYLLTLSILRPFIWREWAVSLMGIIAPWFLLWVVLFLSDRAQLFYDVFNPSNYKPVVLLNSLTKKYIITISSVALLLFLSLLRLRSNYFKNVIKTRNYQISIFILLIVTSFIVLIPYHHSETRFTLLLIPLSAFISYFFLAAKRIWFAELLFACLLVTLLLNYF